MWNFNTDKTREWVNESDNCVAVRIHNDDYRHNPDGTYRPYTIGITSTSASEVDESDANNEAVYAGFSIGGSDGSSSEFGSSEGGEHNVNITAGMALNEMPNRLNNSDDEIGAIHLNYEIEEWNEYWSDLVFVLNIESVNSAGTLYVNSNAEYPEQSLFITDPGRYTFSLGGIDEASDEFILYMNNGGGTLDINIDAVGVASDYMPEADYDIESGWNMISYPYDEHSYYLDIFPFALDTLYYWDPEISTYLKSDSLENATGFWVLADTDTFSNVETITPSDTVSLELKRGWNLIGGPYSTLIIETIIERHPQLIPPVYIFDPSTSTYIPVDEIEANKAYWILVTEEITITLP